jgi:hypothetical protein
VVCIPVHAAACTGIHLKDVATDANSDKQRLKKTVNLQSVALMMYYLLSGDNCGKGNVPHVFAERPQTSAAKRRQSLID